MGAIEEHLPGGGLVVAVLLVDSSESVKVGYMTHGAGVGIVAGVGVGVDGKQVHSERKMLLCGDRGYPNCCSKLRCS